MFILNVNRLLLNIIQITIDYFGRSAHSLYQNACLCVWIQMISLDMFFAVHPTCILGTFLFIEMSTVAEQRLVMSVQNNGCLFVKNSIKYYFI